jgi:hypothetical protein
MSDLTELGQEAIAAVSRGVAAGAPLVKCQLLASAFYCPTTDARTLEEVEGEVSEDVRTGVKEDALSTV